MNAELTCNQVLALIEFYLENKLNPKLKKYIDEHLEICPKCKKFYSETIRKSRTNVILNSTQDKEDKTYKIFEENISAYIDNELNEKENLRIKKIAITNPNAREKIEQIYNLKRFMHNSYEKIKNEMKQDYTRTIMNKILIVETKKEPFYKIVGIFTAMITLIIIGFIAILNL